MLLIFTHGRIIYWNLFKPHIYVTSEFELQILSSMLDFIVNLLGIIFKVFYLVEHEKEDPSIAYFPFMYLNPLPDDGRIEQPKHVIGK